MSFETSVVYYRPDAPRRLDGAQLAAFVRGFAALGLAGEGGARGYEVKYGRSVDRDEHPTHWMEPVLGGISVVREIEYDAEAADLPTLDALVDGLASLTSTIYRANIYLGGLSDLVWEAASRPPSEENEVPLSFQSWTLEVGPIVARSLAGDEEFGVGWMAIGLSGSGYLHPWTLPDLVARIEAIPGISGLMDLCQSIWPVRPSTARRPVIARRRAMGELWPYESLKLPWAWAWSMAEG